MNEKIYHAFEGDIRHKANALVHMTCVWEAASRKIGNVHIHRSFEDMTFLDFCTSASLLAANLDLRIGHCVFHTSLATQLVVGKNTNLGIALLIAPLYACTHGSTAMSNPAYYYVSHRPHIADCLAKTTIHDAKQVYTAIRLVSPGGLGTVAEQDVADEPTVTLREAMCLAADRDLIARQYANDFADVFDLGVPALLDGFERFGCIEAAAIHCHLSWLAAFPDSLIARKNGLKIANDVQDRVKCMMSLGGIETPEGRAAGVALDAHLRSDGNKLNPGTSADLVAACLFIALREGKIPLNAPFPWKVDDWL